MQLSFTVVSQSVLSRSDGVGGDVLVPLRHTRADLRNEKRSLCLIHPTMLLLRCCFF